MQKDKEKSKSASNYRPVTCLPLVWKFLTGVTAEEIYGFLDKNLLLLQEQKGCRRKAGGTNDLLFINDYEGSLNEEVKSNNKKACLTHG